MTRDGLRRTLCRTRDRFLLGLLLAGSFVSCAGPTDSPQPPAETAASPTSTTTPDSTKAVNEDAGEAHREIAGLGRPFWHDGELVEALGLDTAQLSVMETRRHAELEALRQRRLQATETRGALSAALEQGDWPTARQQASALADDASAGVKADIELKIGILDLLTLEQRATLLQKQPSALRRSWLLPGSRQQKGPNPLLEEALAAEPESD